MPLGEIRRRSDPPIERPSIKLPFALRGAEPIFEYLQTTAERTLQIEDRQLEILESCERYLRRLWLSMEPGIRTNVDAEIAREDSD